MKRRHSILLGFTFFAALSGCNVDEIDPENIFIEDASPVIVSELGTINYGIGELLDELESEDFTVDSSNASLIKLTFQESMVITKRDLLDDAEIAEFEDVEENQTLSPFDGLMNPIVNVTADTFEVNLEAQGLIDTLEYEYIQEEGEQNTFDRIFYGGGTLLITATSSSGAEFDYTMESLNTFNTITEEPLIFNGVTGGGSIAQSLEDFNTDFTGDDGATISRFLLRMIAARIPPAGIVSSATTIAVNVVSEGIGVNTIDAIYGAFANDTIEVAGDTINFDGLDDFDTGDLRFNEPSINVDVVNYAGIPITIDLSRVVANTKAGNSIPLDIDASEGEINRVTVSDPPVIAYDDIVPVNDVISINNTNSEIVEVISSIPNSFAFPVSAIINPERQITGHFLALPPNDDDTLISLTTNIELPLNISFGGVEYPLDIDGLDLGEDVNEADSAHIKITANNGLPLNVGASIAFLDANGQEFAPRTENTALLVANQESEAILGLSKTEIQSLLDANDLRVIISISSPPEATIGTAQSLSMTLSAFINPIIEL